MDTPTTPDVIEQPQETSNVIVPEGFDNELDDILRKSFPDAAPKQEEVKDEPKPSEQSKPELVKKDSPKVNDADPKKADKPVEAEKPTLTPEQVDKMDPKEKGAWGAIKNANKRAHEMIVQKDAELSRLKASLAEKGQLSQKEVETLKVENEDLRKYRAMIDIEADPEFISKFDQPIEKTVASIKDMLKGLNVSQVTIDGMDLTNTKLMDQVIGHVGEHADKFLARKLQRKVEELVDLNDKRVETLSEQKDKYKETLEAKKKQSFEKEAEGEGRALRHLDTIKATKDKDGNAVYPFLSPIEAKDGATQPEIDQISNHNKMVEMMSQKVNQAFKMNEPEQRMEVAIAAAAAHYLSAQLKASNNKVQSLQNELKKISSVSTETEKSKPTSIRRNGNGTLVSTDEALESFFAQR